MSFCYSINILHLLFVQVMQTDLDRILAEIYCRLQDLLAAGKMDRMSLTMFLDGLEYNYHFNITVFYQKIVW